MKKLITNTLILFVLLLLGSCGNSPQEVWVNATPVKYVTEFSDTVFFKWINDIEMINENWVVLDKGAGQIHEVSTEFHYLQSMGKPGPGPMEIKGAGNIDAANDKLYIYDYTGRKLNTYSSTGEFLKSTKSYSFTSEFFIDSEKLYVASNEDVNQPFEIVDLNSDSTILKFGKPAMPELNSPPQHIKKFGDHLVTAYLYNRPIIDLYDLQGNFLSRTDLSENPVLAPWLKAADIEGLIRSSTPTMQRAMTMFWDIYAVGENLYIMPPVMEVEGKGKTAYLIQFSVTDEAKLEIDRYINMSVDDGWSFNCFAITKAGDKIIAYDPGNGAIVELQIDPK